MAQSHQDSTDFRGHLDSSRLTPLKPLPDLPGPKLEPFTHDLSSHNVEFLDFAGPNIFRCVDGRVLKVRIDGKPYALKVFIDRYPIPDDEIPHHRRETFRLTDHIDKIKYAEHVSPFHAECRAFGRLKEVGREDLAVKVHGHLKLDVDGKFRTQLLKLIHASSYWESIASLNGVNDIITWFFPSSGAWRNHSRDCILKDWVDDPIAQEDPDHGFKYCQHQFLLYPQMLENLHALHQVGIVVVDIHRNQYVNGVLVDLGQSLTVPHIDSLDYGLQPAWTCASLAANDLYTFQDRVIDATNKDCDRMASKGRKVPKECTLLAYDSSLSRDAMRPASQPYEQPPLLPLIDGSHIDDCEDMTQFPRHDPEDFDWIGAAASFRKKIVEQGGVAVCDFGFGESSSVTVNSRFLTQAPESRKAPSLCKMYDIKLDAIEKRLEGKAKDAEIRAEEEARALQSDILKDRSKGSFSNEQNEKRAPSEPPSVDQQPQKRRRKGKKEVVLTAAFSRPRRPKAKY